MARWRQSTAGGMEGFGWGKVRSKMGDERHPPQPTTSPKPGQRVTIGLFIVNTSKCQKDLFIYTLMIRIIKFVMFICMNQLEEWNE
jgi:hypothetical protein